MGLLDEIPDSVPCLLLAPSTREAACVASACGAEAPSAPWRPRPLADDFDLVQCGVGKANASAATTAAFSARTYGTVINLGIAGMYPGSGLDLGDVVAATRSVYADEGVRAPEGVQSIGSIGFPPRFDESDGGMGVATDNDLLAALRDFADRAGPIATVSTCSGTRESAVEVEARTGALCEAMEGAAIGITLANLSYTGTISGRVRFAEIRVISNSTGDREQQVWDLDRAFARLSDVATRLLRA